MAWGFGDDPQLGIRLALALCYHVGFRTRKRLCNAVAVMTAESQRYPRAWHENVDENGKVRSTDRGLFQVNDKAHPSLSDEDAYRPIPNAAYAFALSSKGYHWSHWSAYNSGAYLKYLPRIYVVWALGLWRTVNVERRLGA